jgi:DNA polymerase-3 subunit alpha (Gram-positive type)
MKNSLKSLFSAAKLPAKIAECGVVAADYSRGDNHLVLHIISEYEFSAHELNATAEELSAFVEVGRLEVVRDKPPQNSASVSQNPPQTSSVIAPWETQPQPPKPANGSFATPANGKSSGYGNRGGRKPKLPTEFKEIVLPFESDKFGKNACLILGKPITKPPTDMSLIRGEGEDVIMWGTVFSIDNREVSNGEKVIIKAYFSDKTSSETLKIFVPAERSDIVGRIKPGVSILAQGHFEHDQYEKYNIFWPKSLMTVTPLKREDHAEEKRVELHMHSKMSDMDAVCEVSDLVDQAFRWRHRAVAITDHGNVQAFPDAMNTFERIKKSHPDADFKMIYGIEAYFVNDGERLADCPPEYPLNDELVIFDLETTGFSPELERITEIGAVKLINLEVVEEFHTLVNAGKHIEEQTAALNGITDETVADAPNEAEALAMFRRFAGNAVLLAHNADFDTGFLRSGYARCGLDYDYYAADTVKLCRAAAPGVKSHRLDAMAKYFKAPEFEHHRALEDAKTLAHIFKGIIDSIRDKKPTTFGELSDALSGVDVKKEKYYHMIILVKNQTGLKNLYRLVSLSHINYYYKKPRIPLSELRKYREGLILGSACEQGELYRGIVAGKNQAQLEQIASLYDFLEIQPIGNNAFMVRKGDVSSEYALQLFNEKVYKLGKKLNIPVVATCDVHFLEADDCIYREVLQAGQGYSDAASQAPLFFRTTEEMLKEFEYLGEAAAKEVVVANANAIADMIEQVRPIPKGTFTPKMEGAEEEIQRLAWGRAKELYGDPLPETVYARLNKELTAIMKYGFSVLYMIAQKLVQRSEEEGYHVGSRGSVGSSFTATMLNISEVNPLPPHYRCPSCKHTEFTDIAGNGFDLPPKSCPQCGTDMERDGHDIPFETFLGFKGDKAPDIDLNFSGEYQSRAHRYTEELFGKENVFKAGTISAVQDKTAFGFVSAYLRERGIEVNKPEKQRLVAGIIGVKATTSQHPGGMVVVPSDKEVYDFTPIQHPANDEDKGVYTTHFDFHALHDTILKLDELGHDVPTLYKRLEESTGMSIGSVPVTDRAVISLFTSTKALKMTEQDPLIPLGTYGLPEFGTNFVIRMLKDAQPKSFADLLQISGLSHGTAVWTGNAAELIASGQLTISDVIGTRDSIMIYLIHKGMEPSMAFKITEITRKGKAKKEFNDEIYAAFEACGVEQWYIDSCKKIQYMFPKAHAAAYVTGAVKLGWFKIYKPSHFYAAVLTKHSGAIDTAAALEGADAVRKRMAAIQQNPESSAKDWASFEALQLILEMLLRGIKFLPAHYEHSHATHFIVEPDGNLRLPFVTVNGCAVNTAYRLYEAVRKGNFVCVDDLKDIAGINSKAVESLKEMNVFAGLPDSKQISLFDF